MTKKHSDCDHIIGYYGDDEAHAELIRDSWFQENGEFHGEGFPYCPRCGKKQDYSSEEDFQT